MLSIHRVTFGPAYAQPPEMSEPFVAEELVKKLLRGELDGILHEEFRKLSYEELEQVAVLLAQRVKGGEAES